MLLIIEMEQNIRVILTCQNTFSNRVALLVKKVLFETSPIIVSIKIYIKTDPVRLELIKVAPDSKKAKKYLVVSMEFHDILLYKEVFFLSVA